MEVRVLSWAPKKILAVSASIFFGLVADLKKNGSGFAEISCEYLQHEIVAGVAVASYDECSDEKYSVR